MRRIPSQKLRTLRRSLRRAATPAPPPPPPLPRPRRRRARLGRPTRLPRGQRLPLLIRRLDPNLEHLERLGEQGVPPERGEPSAAPPLTGQRGLSEQQHAR